MHKAKRGRAKSYDSDGLMMRSVIGVLLIALGVLSIISIVGTIQGAVFAIVKDIMQGLGGVLCLAIPILLIWGGALAAFSAYHKAPVRAFLFVLGFYIFALGIINLLSKVGTVSFVEYLITYNRSNTPLEPNPGGYWQVLQSAFTVCAASGTFAGAIGMLTAWPLWTFAGTTIGVVILGVLCLLCAMFFVRFDIIGHFRQYRESSDERLEKREVEKQRKALQKEQEKQRKTEAKQTNELLKPAWMRKNNPDTARVAAQNPAGGDVYRDAAMAFAGGAYLQGNLQSPGMPVQQTMMMPPTQGTAQLYDEMIVPEMPDGGQTSGFKVKLPLLGRRAISEPATQPASQPQQATTPLDRDAQKVMERMEANRKRKQSLTREIQGGEDGGLVYPETFPGKLNATAGIPAGANMPQGGVSSPTPAHTHADPGGSPQQPTYQAPQGQMADGQSSIHAAQLAFARQAAAYQPPHAAQPHAEVAPSAQDPYQAYRKPAETERIGQPVIKLPKQIEGDAGKPLSKVKKPYPYPMIELLNLNTQTLPDTTELDRANAAKLEQTLESFGIPARVQRVTHGPAVTRFELGLISSGINVKRIMNIADNIALDMAANGGVRIEVPIPGTNLFGVEIPNKEIIGVSLAEVLTSPEMTKAKSPLSVSLGKDIAGRPVICDLAKMPHLLIAGQTGSGKSVCINAIINSLLYRASPDEVRMIMIDPKVVELQGYNKVPHLLIPVVSDPHKAAGALAWAVQEMLDRYHKMQSKGVRELSAYNAKVSGDEPKLPRIVIIIDELSDLMLACKKEVEESIIRLAQLARAAGIHVIVATQRPTVNVITGLIKANIPSRIAFAVASSIDSRTILDMNGAEKLLGKGDMFYYPTGEKAPLRVQGCFVSDAEISNIVDYIGMNSDTDYDDRINQIMDASDMPDADSTADSGDDGDADDRLQEAIEMILTDGQASISMLQRRMKIGYARAGRLIDIMASKGIISKSAGSKPREILMSYEQYLQQKDMLLR